MPLPRPAAMAAEYRGRGMTVWQGAAAVMGLVLLRCAMRQQKGLRSLLAGSVCGMGALALLALTEPLTGVALPLNRFTAAAAAVLGVPGVAAVLALRALLLL